MLRLLEEKERVMGNMEELKVIETDTPMEEVESKRKATKERQKEEGRCKEEERREVEER